MTDDPHFTLLFFIVPNAKTSAHELKTWRDIFGKQTWKGISVKNSTSSNSEKTDSRSDIFKVNDKIFSSKNMFQKCSHIAVLCFINKIFEDFIRMIFFFFFLDSLHARLTRHYQAWGYKLRKRKKIKSMQKLVIKLKAVYIL